MKLLFVHERFGALAGAEVNIHTTAAELKRRGHAVAMLHGPGTGRGESTWRETFSKCFALPATDPAQVLAAAIDTFEPDVIYIHKMADLAVLTALASAPVPRVRMVHDHELYCMRGYKYNYLNRAICARSFSPYCVFPCGACLARNHTGVSPVRWVSYRAKKRELELNRRFNRLVVATQYMRTELARNAFAADRIEVHPPVPNVDMAAPRGAFNDRNRIIYAGQLVRGKGVDVLLESLARVRVPFKCFIFGDGNHREACERLCHRLGLADRVHFKGYVTPDVLHAHCREGSLMVMSSVWPEPFGAVGLEGMHCGLPVVAFDAGGISEWLINDFNGCLVPWMDRGAFAAAIEKLLRNKSLARQLGENGRRLAGERFSFSRYVTGLENLFANVVSETRPATKMQDTLGPAGCRA